MIGDRHAPSRIESNRTWWSGDMTRIRRAIYDSIRHLFLFLSVVCSNCFCKSLYMTSWIPIRVWTTIVELTRTQRVKRCPCTLLLWGSCDETPDFLHCWRDNCLLPLMFCCPAVSLPFPSNPARSNLIRSHPIVFYPIVFYPIVVWT